MYNRSGMLARLWSDEEGATAIEYALIASLISIAILVGAQTIGQKLGNTFNNIASNLT